MCRANPSSERAIGEALQQVAIWMGQLQLSLDFAIFLFMIYSRKETDSGYGVDSCAHSLARRGQENLKDSPAN